MSNKEFKFEDIYKSTEEISDKTTNKLLNRSSSSDSRDSFFCMNLFNHLYKCCCCCFFFYR